MIGKNQIMKKQFVTIVLLILIPRFALADWYCIIIVYSISSLVAANDKMLID